LKGSTNASAPAGLFGAALVALAASVYVSAARGQDAAPAADTIIARKTVMNALGDRMDNIEAMIASGKAINLDEAHDAADAISVFLMAFPHLFPPATNQWKPGADKDPATDTFASPELWTKFADFYGQATEASKAAYDASRAENEAALKAAIAKLRTDCNTCHAAYMKTE
jgi:cytochrome c556